jgi:hypothetical protein
VPTAANGARPSSAPAALCPMARTSTTSSGEPPAMSTDPQGREADGSASRAADEVRAGHQPQDRESSRVDDPPAGSGPGGRGDPLEARADTTGGRAKEEQTVTRFHLAQANIGRIRAPLDDPSMEGFRSQLEPINALADRSPGFVWRLQTEDGNAMSIRPFADERMAINMSVWESLEALQQFVYRSAHVGPLRDRKQWFESTEGPILVLWWIPAGHVPTVTEAQERLRHLEEVGPSPRAFTFRMPFPSPDGQSGGVAGPDATSGRARSRTRTSR